MFHSAIVEGDYSYVNELDDLHTEPFDPNPAEDEEDLELDEEFRDWL